MIIKKLGALLLTAIIALTLVITPVISATQDNTVLQGKTCNSTDNCKKTELRPDFVNSLSLNKVPIGHVNELHVTKKQYTGCTIELLCINKKGKWEYVGGESIYLDIYNSHGQIIWSRKNTPASVNGTDFIYQGSV